MRILLAILPLSVAACGFASPNLPPPPAGLVEPCARPVALPDRGLSQAETETYWRRDRLGLLDCGARLDGLAGYVRDLRW